MKKGFNLILYLSLTIWLLVSFAALAAMYKLWWERERQNYMGQPFSQQQQTIWAQSGLPTHLLPSVSDLKGAVHFS